VKVVKGKGTPGTSRSAKVVFGIIFQPKDEYKTVLLTQHPYITASKSCQSLRSVIVIANHRAGTIKLIILNPPAVPHTSLR
jgi:hypothetical protein